MNTVNLNVVPKNAPRKVVLSNGVMYRFGFQPINGSDFSKVGEIAYPTVPPVSELKGVQQEYCRAHSIDEPFNPADYGFEETE